MFAKALGLLIAAAAAVAGLPAAAGAQGKRVYVIVTVKAERGWQRVPLRLGGHGVLHFHANGRWVFNPSQPAVDGDGAANLSTAGRTSYTFSGTQGREGQLIGRIGAGGAPFVAGARGFHQVARREAGPLYLMINDDFRQSAGAGLADNSGTLRVRVDYDR